MKRINNIKRILSDMRSWGFSFALSLAILFGPAFAVFSEYNYENPDIETYMGLATGHFNQSPVRRYRLIVPALAAGVDAVFRPVFNYIKPWKFDGPNFSLCMSFFIVNLLLMALFGALIHQFLLSFAVSKWAALFGLLSVLTSRWTGYFAGLPLVDNLYLAVIALVFYSIKSENKKLLALAIIIGPWAKESFVFLAPLILYFAKFWSRKQQVLVFLLAGLLVFSFRYAFDFYNALPAEESLIADFDAFHDIGQSLGRLLSFHGVYELFSVLGPWNLFFIFLFESRTRKAVFQALPPYALFFLAIVLLHALLSVELARMFYLFTPILALTIALIYRSTLEELHYKS